MTTTIMPTWDEVRDRVNAWGAECGEWAGVPLVIDGHRLVIEPKYPFAGLQGATLGDKKDATCDDDFKVRNMFRCRSRNVTVVIMEESDGRVTHCFLGEGHARRATMAMHTLGVAASPAWSIDAETNAMAKLKSLIGNHRFRQYVMTGTFTETSKRSGVVYMFRRLRPTLAIRTGEETSRVLAALCLHPIGYYEETFAGVMVPTDCVVAHLLLMRSDERRYWSQANQHAPDSPESGI